MKTAELRDAYIQFFSERGHRIVPSSPLVPQNDPTLLFTNSGMVQFKDPLLGRADLDYQRAVSAQRCVRAGGKHNDLENVGYTARHHTFFEMMGNFSFGDYFKEETITWAWEFVAEVLKLPKERIWVTVHPTDDEARKLWQDKIGFSSDRVIDLEENFWTMGDTGPCGPCTELFYDHGPDVAGGPPGSPDEDGDRYIEFWNLVFPQFDRAPDGELTPLPRPGVDTGMGLERMAAIMQGVHANYEIDLFRALMREAGSFAGIKGDESILGNPSLCVIADHIRSSAFLIADGVTPGSEDRAYVLRRIIRRALRHGHKLGIEGLFFHKLLGVLVNEMGEAYPILAEQQNTIEKALRAEEERFSETLNQGMSLLENRIGALGEGEVIPGETVFQLYDTYGFPADLTADIARERGLTADMDGFEVAMEAQRERGRASASFATNLGQRVTVNEAVAFTGYEATTGEAHVLGVFDAEGSAVDSISVGDAGVVVLDRTPFYAESGGQVGDRGNLVGNGVRFEVNDTLVTGVQHMHIGTVAEGQISVGDGLEAHIDDARRAHIRRNHSATHLLHAALRKVLGNHVQQKGSLVTEEKLRFDFSHEQPVTKAELAEIQALVNEQIMQNSVVETELMGYDAAIEKGATALFGEKYGDEVRVLSMGGDYSVELCGGTHVARTGDIGPFAIVQETGIAAGVRRVEAVSGLGAQQRMQARENLLDEAAALLKGQSSELLDKVQALIEENRTQAKQIADLAQQLAASQSSDLADQIVDVAGAAVIAAEVQGDGKALMDTLDMLKSQQSSYVICLIQQAKGKINMVAAVSQDLHDKLGAPDVLAELGAHVGVKGGGKPDLARGGGGNNPAGLADALAALEPLASARLT